MESRFKTWRADEGQEVSLGRRRPRLRGVRVPRDGLGLHCEGSRNVERTGTSQK